MTKVARADAFAAIATFRTVDRIGYNGTITFESFSSAVVSPALTRALCVWHEMRDNGMELAEQLAGATA